MAEVRKEVLEAVEEIRRAWRESDAKRDAGLPTSFPEVTRFDNLRYGEHGKDNLLDIYIPANTTEPVPTVISMHGGGFVYGDKELYQHYCLGWARNGFGVVNFNYRLGPEHVFPVALQDAAAAVEWVAQHAQTYHLDLENVFLVGDSAGGTLAFQYLLANGSAEYRQQLNLPKSAITIRAAGLNCGFYFLDRPDAFTGDNLVGMAYFTPEVRAKYAKLLRAEDFMNEDFPPVYVMTSNQDFLHDEGVRLDQFLLDHHWPHQFKIYGTDAEPRGHVFHIDQRDAVGKLCNQEEKKYFERFIRRGNRVGAPIG